MQVIYNGTEIDVKKSTRVNELLKDEIKKATIPIIACKFNNELKSLNYPIISNGKIELIDISQKDGMRVYKRGLVYIVSKAFNELYPKALLTINYQLYHSMFCDVENLEITNDVILNVKKKVKEIVERNISIDKKIMTKKEAIKFYEKEKTLKGKLQLDLESKKEVTLYYCENYYNYFYGVMPINTGILKSYDVIKYFDGFLIRYPSRKTINTLPKFIECPKLFSTLREYDEMHKILEVNTLYKLNMKIKEGQIKDYILLDEALHEKKIANIADSIANNRDIKVILIAGPSSSGKTTFAKRLSIQLKINGLKPKTISVDNYFVEREENPKDENGEYDFECIEAIDTKLLNNNLISLLNGEEIDMPTFNFQKGTKEFKRR
jgi:uridine kinase